MDDESVLIPTDIKHGPPSAEEAGRSKILSHFMRSSIAFHPHNGEPGMQRTFGIRIPAPKLLQSAACDDMHAGSRRHALTPEGGDHADALALVLHSIWASTASAW